MAKDLDETWQRFPEARVRMRDNAVKTILDGLGEDGFCLAAIPKLCLVDEGIYVDILLNVGKHGSVIALPLEILIPAKIPAAKKPAKEEVEEVEQPAEPTSDE